MPTTINLFAPTKPHAKQKEVLKTLDDGSRFTLLRAGRKFRKTSLAISWLFEGCFLPDSQRLTFPFIAPSRIQAKNIVWDDHIQRLLEEFNKKGLVYKTNETELSVKIKGGGRVQLYGVENSEALRGISNWGRVVCLDGDSKIKMAVGEKKIKDIKIGEYVKTPYGIRKVLNSGKTGEVDSLMEISLSTGEKIRCTNDHKIYSQSGVIKADELCYNDFIWTEKFIKQLSSMVLNIDLKKEMDIIDQGLVEKNLIYIEKYGKNLKEIFQLVELFITKMGISLIIKLITLFVLLLQNIQNHIQNIEIDNTQKDLEKCLQKIKKNLLNGLEAKRVGFVQKRILRKLLNQLGNGMDQKRAKSFTLNLLKIIGKTGKKQKKPVMNVEKNMNAIIQEGLNIVPLVVGIKSLSGKEKKSVYNLTINKDHCYYANGILVKNCDEYDDWQQDIYPLIIRPNLITHKAPVLFTGTPKGKKNLWRIEQEPYVKSFHFTSMDNPDIDEDELVSLINEYKGKGEDYYRQEILAEYVKPAGVVYREWNEQTQFIDLEYEPSLPIHVSFDFGVNDPTSIIWFQPSKTEIRVIDYYEASNANIEHFISYINSKPYKPAELYTGDPAGKARTLTTGTSVIEMMSQKGIFVRTKDGVKIPDQIRIAHQYMPILYVSNKLARFRDCLLNYRYPEIKSNVRNQENEIPIHDEFSHAMRALEYWAVNYNIINPYKKIEKKIATNTGAELISLIENRRSGYSSLKGWR